MNYKTKLKELFTFDTRERQEFAEFIVVSVAAIAIGLILVILLLNFWYAPTGIPCRGILCWLTR